MRNKLLITLLIMVTLCFVGCGNESEKVEGNNGVEKDSQTSNDREDISENEKKDEMDFSQSVLMVGYNIGCPSSAGVLPTNYGNMFTFEKTHVIIESPSTVGIMLDVVDVEDSVNVCQKYIIDSVEDNARKLFAVGQTEQIINETEVITINEIEMLRVNGVLNNLEDDKSIPYVAYYFLSGTDPVYVIGIELDETADVESFMDEFAKQIKKN